MTPTPFHDKGLKGGLPFILGVWMAISVALLSALAPLGPPSSRLTGSAFNPATTSVVLKARAHAAPVPLRAAEPDGDGRSPDAVIAPVALIAMAATLLIGFWLLRPDQGFSIWAVALKPRYRFSRPCARAPPTLS